MLQPRAGFPFPVGRVSPSGYVTYRPADGLKCRYSQIKQRETRTVPVRWRRVGKISPLFKLTIAARSRALRKAQVDPIRSDPIQSDPIGPH